MGVDWGVRRIGLALSDPTLTLARPLDILVRKGADDPLGPTDEEVFLKMADLVRENEVVGLVFGVPFYHLSGDPNPRASLFLETGRLLGERLSLPVYLHDEGQTSARARELLPKRKRPRGRKGFCDDLAAVLLLQGFLDERAAEAQKGFRASGEGSAPFSEGRTQAL